MIQDRKDAQILALLQTNCRLTAEAIGEIIGLSSTAVTRRLKRLRESGTIEAEVAILSMKVAGPFVTALLLCTLDPDGPIQATKFGEYVRKRVEVINAYYVAGTPDVALEIVSPTIEDHQRFAYELSEAFPNLKNASL